MFYKDCLKKLVETLGDIIVLFKDLKSRHLYMGLEFCLQWVQMIGR